MQLKVILENALIIIIQYTSLNLLKVSLDNEALEVNLIFDSTIHVSRRKVPLHFEVAKKNFQLTLQQQLSSHSVG